MHKNRHIDQWNRIESPEIYLCLYGQLIFDYRGTTVNGVKTVSSVNAIGRIGLVNAKKNENRPLTYTMHQNKIKMDTGLNISHDVIKVLVENTGSKFSDIPCNNIFANISPRPREIKEKVNKQDYIKLKCFYMAKEPIIKMQGN